MITQERVQAAVQSLQAEGKPTSSRNILRYLRRTPPRYMGASFRDLLPILRRQRDLSPYDQLDHWTRRLHEATEAKRWDLLPELIDQGHAAWTVGRAQLETPGLEPSADAWRDRLGKLMLAMQEAQWRLSMRQ